MLKYNPPNDTGEDCILIINIFSYSHQLQLIEKENRH
jgi:hypothetical protein